MHKHDTAYFDVCTLYLFVMYFIKNSLMLNGSVAGHNFLSVLLATNAAGWQITSDCHIYIILAKLKR